MFRLTSLQRRWRPRVHNGVELQGMTEVIELASMELTSRAIMDPDAFFGYFPGATGDGIDHDLPACELAAMLFPTLTIAGQEYDLNFFKKSLIGHESRAGAHLDSGVHTALEGKFLQLRPDKYRVLGRKFKEFPVIWRALVNLSTHAPRTVQYLDLEPSRIPLKQADGYISPDLSGIYLDAVTRSVELAPRVGNIVSVATFAVSHVLHSGASEAHFLGGYGFVEEVA